MLILPSLALTLVENEALAAPKAPEISVAICAELETNVFAVTTSFAATLDESEALVAPNAPDMSEAI